MRRLSVPAQHFLSSLCLLAVPYLFWLGQAAALQLASRSVQLSTAIPSATASHGFRLDIRSTDAIGSIVFEYCGNSPLPDVPCSPPAGLDLAGAGLTAQTGNTGFAVAGAYTTTNKLVISRPAAAANAVASSYDFDNVINPSGDNQTTYVRISTHAADDGSGTPIDDGSVAFSTIFSFAVGAYVPPFLNFCAGVTVAADCSQMDGDSLDLGVLSSQVTRSASSQFAASTNDPGGYSVYLLGNTLTAGNNVIPAAVSQPAAPGGGRFGINLRQNSSPPVGGDPSGAGTGLPSAGYATPNFFRFVPGEQIASSPIATDYNRLTVSYIVNVAASQPPGIYVTTVTYLAAAQF